MNAGGQKAAAALGNVQWLYQGPTQADAAAQADIVRSFIQQKVDTLIVAPNDPDSMAPLLQQAKDAGIHVATVRHRRPQLGARGVRQPGVGGGHRRRRSTDALMKAMGGKGKYAIVSCGADRGEPELLDQGPEGRTPPSKYPEAQIVDTVYAGEDQAKATQMATDLMNAHPDLTGLVGECTSSAPGVAQAVQDASKIGKVFTVGLGTPQSMKPYLEDGLVVGVDPVGRREPRLPDRVGRRAAGGGQAVRRDQQRQRRPAGRSSTTRRPRPCCSARRWRSPRTTSTSSTTDRSGSGRATRAPGPGDTRNGTGQ